MRLTFRLSAAKSRHFAGDCQMLASAHELIGLRPRRYQIYSRRSPARLITEASLHLALPAFAAR